jgi:hypothetical protein
MMNSGFFNTLSAGRLRSQVECKLAYACSRTAVRVVSSLLMIRKWRGEDGKVVGRVGGRAGESSWRCEVMALTVSLTPPSPSL